MSGDCSDFSVKQIVITVGLDEDKTDLRSPDLLCRKNAMPAIYELVLLIDLIRGQFV